MLKEIAIVTIIATNIGQVQTGWERFLGYTVADRGTVSSELSEHWQAPAMKGAKYIVMQPANDAPVYVRFVEDETAGDYRAMTTHGWNSTELLVSDPDALARTLENRYFETVGEPMDLWDARDAPRAMQALGPGGELLYLTRNNPMADALGLDESMPLVERVFIMVVGGPSMEEFRNFYGDTLGLKLGDPTPFQLGVFALMNEADASITYPLAVAPTAPGYLIEFDELPESLPDRNIVPGHLPPGIAMVGFNAGDLSGELHWHSEPRKLHEFPYDGHRAGILLGPAGELIELIETSGDD
jgi:catechol 2,3-dioxygenase-like lactoylglutathione lyase family enzyme